MDRSCIASCKLPKMPFEVRQNFGVIIGFTRPFHISSGEFGIRGYECFCFSSWEADWEADDGLSIWRG